MLIALPDATCPSLKWQFSCSETGPACSSLLHPHPSPWPTGVHTVYSVYTLTGALSFTDLSPIAVTVTVYQNVILSNFSWFVYCLELKAFFFFTCPSGVQFQTWSQTPIRSLSCPPMLQGCYLPSRVGLHQAACDAAAV